MQKITPFLWFDGKAEDAANFYVSIFSDGKILDVTRYGEAGPGIPGSVMIVRFAMNGQEFIALNGGPQFTFTPAISFVINCETQDEIDYYWHQLSSGGTAQQCGWLTDKYGLSWQVVPTILSELMQDSNPERSDRVMKALLKMAKLDIAELKNASAQA